MFTVKANEILQAPRETQEHRHKVQNRFLFSFRF